jgi:hypothetical protein
MDLIAAVEERRRAELVAQGIDDSARSCDCGRRLRSDNATGRCARCQRLHRDGRHCVSCHRPLDARSRSLVCRSPACLRRVAEAARLTLGPGAR